MTSSRPRNLLLALLTMIAMLSAQEALPEQSAAKSPPWKSVTPVARIETQDNTHTIPDTVLLTASKWNGGERALAMWEKAPGQRDWSAYDRLAIPVFCDSPYGCFTLEFVIFDTPNHDWTTCAWWMSESYISGHGSMLVMPFKTIAAKKKTRLSRIQSMQVYVDNPRYDLKLYLGNMTLLKPGEPVPPLPAAMAQASRQRSRKTQKQQMDALETRLQNLQTDALNAPQRTVFKSIRSHFLQKLRQGDFASILNLLGPENTPLSQVMASTLKVMSHQPQTSRQDVLVGYAPPTLKVLPEVPLFQPLPQTLTLEAARNENESLQLIVMPTTQACHQVKVTFSDFTGNAGKLPADAISSTPVGFVETKTISRAGTPHLGAWPDPLLAFLDHVSIRPFQAQPFWIKAQIPGSQPPGTYRGTTTVWIGQKSLCTLPLTIKVRNFTLPKHSMLPLAVTFNPRHQHAGKQWRKHMDQWHQMLTGYYLDFNSLYYHQPPEDYYPYWLKRQKRGELTYFNLGNWEELLKQKHLDYTTKSMEQILLNLRPAYQKAKELGLLKYAYLYGGDELRKTKFKALENMVTIVKREFPGIPVFTTAYNDDLGKTALKSSMDWFCPLISRYEQELKAVKTLRQAGKKVWWYTCCEPLPPYPNSFIESRGAEMRLIMGAMTAKYRPDGFLFWQISIWLHPGTITKGPHTGWDGRSYRSFNGDGCWCYPGPDAKPIPTIRLENFRDGLEDYAYAKLLENALTQARKQGLNNPWTKQAEAAIQVPDTLVKNLKDYSVDFQHLQHWRLRMAELLEQTPAPQRTPKD